MFYLKIVMAFLIVLTHLSNVYAAPGNQKCIKATGGINLAGAGFSSNKIPGRLGYDYKFPDYKDLLYYKKKGFKIMRLSILWERIQSNLYSDLRHSYLNEIKYFLDKAEELNLLVLIDLHNYGRYKKEIIGNEQVPNDAFFDVWYKIASELKDYPALYAYGLMNEPHNTKGHWHKVAQYGVNGIRLADKKHTIYVDGDNWSSSWKWPKSNPKPFVNDPENNLVYEAHIYFDKDSSGVYKNKNDILKIKDVTKRIIPFVNWLKRYHLKGAIGEWGVPTNDPNWLPVANEFLNITNAHCLDWYVWAGGAWGKNYPLSLEPINQKDKLLLLFLSKKLKAN